MKLKYYHNLDGLRGIAALMVLICHFFSFPLTAYIDNIDSIQKWTDLGQHGVSMFFVLSGFVITRILINNRKNSHYFTDFYKRRVLRIAPLYYLFLIIYYLFPLTYEGDLIEFKHQIPHYLYLQNLKDLIGLEGYGPGHYWTLAVEEHFYLLWPLTIFIVKPKHLSKFIFISILVIFLLKYIMLNDDLSINKFTFTRVDQMMLGAYLAILELKGFFSKKGALQKMLATGLTILPVMLVVFIFDKQFPFLKEMFKYFLLGIFFFSLIGSLIILNKDNYVNKMLSNRVFQYLGKISYGIYVWHVLVLKFMEHFLLTKIILVDFLLSFVLTILLAHISYYYFEIYFLKLKSKKLNFKKIKYKFLNF